MLKKFPKESIKDLIYRRRISKYIVKAIQTKIAKQLPQKWKEFPQEFTIDKCISVLPNLYLTSFQMNSL